MLQKQTQHDIIHMIYTNNKTFPAKDGFLQSFELLAPFCFEIVDKVSSRNDNRNYLHICRKHV